MAVLVLACIAFTVAMVRGIGTSRLLATSFVLVATIMGALLFRILQGSRGDQDDLMQAVSTNQLTARERRAIARRICLARAFMSLLVVCLVFAWTRMRGGPMFPRIIGTLFNLLWTAGLILYIRRQHRRLK
jgi:hypothetical protein